MLTFKDKYDILLRKDARYEGIFIAAVKTTGIFCKPGCSARKPKPENVVFYDSAEEAMGKGFRPCLKCRPMEKNGEMPSFIHRLLEELDNDPGLRITDAVLIKRKLAPGRIRRWFKKHYHMTFHAYQRKRRINNAFREMSGGSSITRTAFHVGFGSISGFADSYRSVFGKAPSRAKETTVISMAQFASPLGPMIAGATTEGLCLLEFTNRIRLEKEMDDLKKRLQAVMLPGNHPYLGQVQQELAEYFEGMRQTFTIPLVMPGSTFEQAVWQQLQSIPYGETWSYKEQALCMQRANATRAIGAANGRNRLVIIVPCHRVIGSNGNLTGYAAGIEKKQWLLNLERKYSSQ